MWDPVQAGSPLQPDSVGGTGALLSLAAVHRTGRDLDGLPTPIVIGKRLHARGVLHPSAHPLESRDQMYSSRPNYVRAEWCSAGRGDRLAE